MGTISSLRNAVTFLLVMVFALIALDIAELWVIDDIRSHQKVQDERISQCRGRMLTYEKRTTDALDNWDSMRKTQLVLMDLLQNRN